MAELIDPVEGLHHITVSTGSAQGDIDLLVKVLGQRLVKRTMFYDGPVPMYHLYFGNELGDAGTLFTTFPVRQAGLKGRRGNGQISAVSYNAPLGSLDWWRDHLAKHNIHSSEIRERFGQKFIAFDHPDCGVGFELIEQDASATFKPWSSPFVPDEYALNGFHSWTAKTFDIPEMHDFMKHAWNLTPVGRDGDYHRYAFGAGGAGKIVDLLIDPDDIPGTWALGEGTVHHAAFGVADVDVQAELKFAIEGMGYTDVSDRKHRGYFESVYVRTPGGVMFEAAASIGFTVDEPAETLGEDTKVAPVLEGRVDELLEMMNDPIVL